MKKIILLTLILILNIPYTWAYKIYYYDNNGERVYITVTPEMAKKNKSRPRRAYIRKPRTNWEITDSMRSRKMTISQYMHRD